MRRMLPIYVAAGASLGVIVAYLLAGGASYKPLAAADPCEPRSAQVLAERGVFEAIALSALDGAACELGVSREELTAALGDPDSLAAFAEANEVDESRIVEAVRAGLIRAVADAERDGRLSGTLASLARVLVENAPVPLLIDLFQALPGDPTVAELLSALAELGVGLGDLPELGLDSLDGIVDELNGLFSDGLGDLLPQQLPEVDPGALEQRLPDPSSLPGLDQLRDQLDGLLGGSR